MSEVLKTVENRISGIQSLLTGSQTGMIDKSYYDMSHPDNKRQETPKENAEQVKSRFINAFKE
jgi:hypothetical protein